MSNYETLLLIAQHTRSLDAQREIINLADPVVISQLPANKQLHPEIWDTLYNYLPAENWLAKALLFYNAPDAKRYAKILEQPFGATLLTALRLGSTYLTAELIQKLTALHYGAVASTLLAYKNDLDPDLAAQLIKSVFTDLLDTPEGALASHNRPLIAIQNAVLRYGAATDEQLLELLTEFTSSNTYSLVELDELTAPLLDIRPTLIEKLLLTPTPRVYYPAIAASRFITVDTALALQRYLMGEASLTEQLNYDIFSNLIENPNLPAQLRADLCSYYITKKQIAEPLPGSLGVSPSWQALRDLYQSLADANTPPNTNNWVPTPGRVDEEVTQALESLGDWRYPALFFPNWRNDSTYQDATELPDTLNVPQVVDLPLDAIGPEGWRVFINTLPDWSGELSELAEVINSITTK